MVHLTDVVTNVEWLPTCSCGWVGEPRPDREWAIEDTDKHYHSLEGIES